MARRLSCQTRSGLNGRTQALRSKAQRTARNRRASLGRSYQCSETAARIPAPGTSHVPVGECRRGVADKKGRPRRATFFFNLSSERPLASEFCCRDHLVHDCSKAAENRRSHRRTPRAYIGGATPWLPTTTRPDVRAPSPPRSATTKTEAPGVRSAGLAAAKVTMGVSAGIDIFFSCPPS
jgi:hypothetical protein